MKRKTVLAWLLLAALLLSACGAAKPTQLTEETAADYIGRDVSELISAFGEPEERKYVDSCLGPGEDGELLYGEILVYTYREEERETVQDVGQAAAATPVPSPTPTMPPASVEELSFQREGSRLYALDEKGERVCSCTVGRLIFDDEGWQTSGLPELDEKIQEILKETVDFETMEPMEQLYAVYEYAAKNFHYLSTEHFEPGSTGWEAQAAYELLEKEKGNCYNRAALFAELARALGYDAEVVSGSINGSPRITDYDSAGNPIYGDVRTRDHGWVEIEIDGELLLFDPQMEHAKKAEPWNKFFAQDDSRREQYGYRKAGE